LLEKEELEIELYQLCILISFLDFMYQWRF
jgi:hypothetical protein